MIYETLLTVLRNSKERRQRGNKLASTNALRKVKDGLTRS